MEQARAHTGLCFLLPRGHCPQQPGGPSHGFLGTPEGRLVSSQHAYHPSPLPFLSLEIRTSLGVNSLHPVPSQLEAPCYEGGYEASCGGFSRSCLVEGQYLFSSWPGAVHHCLWPLTFRPSHPYLGTYLRNVLPSTWGTTPDLGNGLLSSLLHSQAGNWPQEGEGEKNAPAKSHPPLLLPPRGGGGWNLGTVPPGFPPTSELSFGKHFLGAHLIPKKMKKEKGWACSWGGGGELLCV